MLSGTPLMWFIVELQNQVDSALAVSNLTWGTNGSFAFNVWFTQTVNQGNLFQYLISARDPLLPAINDTSIFLPNEVSLLPLHPPCLQLPILLVALYSSMHSKAW